MTLDLSFIWSAWWGGRGKSLSCLSTTPSEKLHLGYFLREAEIWWRKCAPAVRARMNTEQSSFEMRGKALSQALVQWWDEQSSTMVDEAQRFIREFPPESPNDDPRARDLRKLFAAMTSLPAWEKHPAWENPRRWVMKVRDVLMTFGHSPLGLAPIPRLPFDPASLPLFADSRRFVLSSLLWGLDGSQKTVGLSKVGLETEIDNLLKRPETSFEDGVVAFSVAAVANRDTLCPPRVFHEFCMDLAASPIPALQMLDCVFQAPSAHSLQVAADWMVFALWDSVSQSSVTHENEDGFLEAPQFESRGGIRDWIRNGGLLSSKDAHPLARLVSVACNTVWMHLVLHGAPLVVADPNQDAASRTQLEPSGVAPVMPADSKTSAQYPLITVGKAVRGQGRQVDVPIAFGGETHAFKERVAILAKKLGETGRISGGDNRTLAPLFDKFPELERLIQRKKGNDGKPVFEAPHLVGRVAES